MIDKSFFIKRLVAYRELKKLNQEQLSKAMGFKDRQTLSAIETGTRELKPSELLQALKVLDISLEQFSDPYSLVGEANYSWRQCEATEEELSNYEDKTSRIVALLKDLDEKFSTTSHSVILPKLPITKNSTFHDVTKCAEQLVKEFNLGDFPADNLEELFFRKFNVSKLYVDMPNSISGAAIKLNTISVILINRNEIAGRRNFDTAHEAFHCLTWDAIPPKHVEKAYSNQKKKPYTEKLADAFASALLMPSESIEKYITLKESDITEDVINNLANKYGVSSIALMWRLVSLDKISRSHADRLDKELMAKNGQKDGEDLPPKLFNKQFVQYIHKSIDSGTLSVRKILSILDMTMEELNGLLVSYNLTVPYDL
ncbi:ImmA/IrrE family metallo-endopeptidase [Enterovibrio paralichthyis]|uniref:ImmA/IrrE family metallo-endopeptidase n=1 Tax=Enterovibrio paralichthyis TaxID=2853805 RepID=UPI001C478AF4|nr:XRE family transcriptional regulator [Enterovibrio paralichthyis]MBV7298253.1 XRE family transcriptional regulator [Enterovibrio paralichthyis]